MKIRFRFFMIVIFLISMLAFSACSGASQDGAASAVEGYYQALVAKDAARLSSFSCAEWEDDAAIELDSLAAVTVSLKDLACQVSGQAGDETLVTCTGALLANYEGEDQEIDLADRTYIVVQEGGEWRMCGYQ